MRIEDQIEIERTGVAGSRLSAVQLNPMNGRDRPLGGPTLPCGCRGRCPGEFLGVSPSGVKWAGPAVQPSPMNGRDRPLGGPTLP